MNQNRKNTLKQDYLAHAGKKGMKWGYNDGQRNGKREAVMEYDGKKYPYDPEKHMITYDNKTGKNKIVPTTSEARKLDNTKYDKQIKDHKKKKKLAIKERVLKALNNSDIALGTLDNKIDATDKKIKKKVKKTHDKLKKGAKDLHKSIKKGAKAVDEFFDKDKDKLKKKSTKNKTTKKKVEDNNTNTDSKKKSNSMEKRIEEVKKLSEYRESKKEAKKEKVKKTVKSLAKDTTLAVISPNAAAKSVGKKLGKQIKKQMDYKVPDTRTYKGLTAANLERMEDDMKKDNNIRNKQKAVKTAGKVIKTTYTIVNPGRTLGKLAAERIKKKKKK